MRLNSTAARRVGWSKRQRLSQQVLVAMTTMTSLYDNRAKVGGSSAAAVAD